MTTITCTWCPRDATVDSGEGFLLCDECEALLRRRLAILNSNKQLETPARDITEKPPGLGVSTGPRRAGQESAATDSELVSAATFPALASTSRSTVGKEDCATTSSPASHSSPEAPETAETEPSQAPVSAFSSRRIPIATKVALVDLAMMAITAKFSVPSIINSHSS